MAHIAIGTNGDKTLYGVGDTAHEAIQDAIRDIQVDDASQDPDEDDFETVPCTDTLQAQVLGGNNDYRIRDGHAYTHAEACAVDDGLDVADDGTATGVIELDVTDAENIDAETSVEVMITEGRMTVKYASADGREDDIAEEPSDPEQIARSYDYNLRNVYAATLDLVAQGLKRDAEAEADAEAA